jgi:hypothetical protein
VSFTSGVSRETALLPLVWGFNMTKSLLGLVLTAQSLDASIANDEAFLNALSRQVGAHS